MPRVHGIVFSILYMKGDGSLFSGKIKKLYSMKTYQNKLSVILANFTLPEEGTLFDTIEFPEQTKEEIDTLVEQYRKEGKEALPPPEKKFKGDSMFFAIIHLLFRN